MQRSLLFLPILLFVLLSNCQDHDLPDNGGFIPCDTIYYSIIEKEGRLLVTQHHQPLLTVIAQWTSDTGQAMRIDTLFYNSHLNYPHGHPDLEVLSIHDTTYLYFSSAIEQGTSEARTVTFGLYRLTDGQIFSQEYEEVARSIVFDRILHPNLEIASRPDLLNILNDRSQSTRDLLARDTLESIYAEFIDTNHAALNFLWSGSKEPHSISWMPNTIDFAKATHASVTSQVYKHDRYTFIAFYKGPVVGIDKNTSQQWVVWAPRNKLDWIEKLSLQGDTLVIGTRPAIFCNLNERKYRWSQN